MAIVTFAVLPRGKLRCSECAAVVNAADVQVTSMSREEGETNPDDESATFSTTCPSCSRAGVLTLGYGPAASEEDLDALSALGESAQALRAKARRGP